MQGLGWVQQLIPGEVYLPPLNMGGTDVARHHEANSTLNLKKKTVMTES